MKELLTGKCKEDFEKWYNENNPYKFDSSLYGALLGGFITHFENLNFIYKYGVYLEFFDSVDLGLNVTDWTENKEVVFLFSVTEFGNPSQYGVKPSYKSRQEAQQQAIIKANSIYNERH